MIGEKRTTAQANRSRMLVQVGLSISLLWICSCSDRPSEEGAAVVPGALENAESGYFVDRPYLENFCVTSGVAYPIVTDERTIDGTNPAATDATLISLYLDTFTNALNIYPRKLLDEIGLRKIVLGHKFSVDGTACNAFADVEHGTLFLNLDAGPPDGFTKRTLHHEFFHFVDFAEDDRLDEDRPWSSLNPPGFLYGSGGGSMQNDSGVGGPGESLIGFVNRYATSGLAEDKAEVYASLIFDGAWMSRRASADSIIGRKVERIRSSLRRLGPLTSGLLSRFR